MKHFITLKDLPKFKDAVDLAKSLKQNPYEFEAQGKRKTLGLLFKEMIETKLTR